jgi:DNA damage-inducible protein 1
MIIQSFVNLSEKFSKMIRELQSQRKERDVQRQRLLSSNPFDQEAQKLIAEEIRQKNIEANMEAAMEYNPESFATVVMLYIDCRVNGHPIKAFVDSGRQCLQNNNF